MRLWTVSASAILACLIGFNSGTAAAAGMELVTPGHLTMAYRTDDKPVSFIQNGAPSGFFVDLENAIAARLGLKAVFISTTFAAMVPAVRNHQYDSAAFGVLVTPARRAVVNFTTPVGYSLADLVSLRSAPIERVEGAQGKTVAITVGSALIPLLQKIAPTVTVKTFPNLAASANALAAGQVDGLFTGQEATKQLLDRHPEFVASQGVSSGEIAMPVAKDNPELLKAVNGALAEIMKNGTFTKLFAKWMPPSVIFPDELYQDYPGMPHFKRVSAN
ncbi:MAG: ABC transporter substrate-binding protein [Hyphomicrobiales bacterium]|nr:ABC transporter substrate-binding protein [Hyphomicrobiales bacterium]MDE2114461.1 amino acid ABC transporter substrate-binding protein [Hyphomicrobiales bacterium]